MGANRERLTRRRLRRALGDSGTSGLENGIQSFCLNLFAENDFTLFCVSEPGGCLLKGPPADEAARG
jgi:hypothetical protein